MTVRRVEIGEHAVRHDRVGRQVKHAHVPLAALLVAQHQIGNHHARVRHREAASSVLVEARHLASLAADFKRAFNREG